MGKETKIEIDLNASTFVPSYDRKQHKEATDFNEMTLYSRKYIIDESLLVFFFQNPFQSPVYATIIWRKIHFYIYNSNSLGGCIGNVTANILLGFQKGKGE